DRATGELDSLVRRRRELGEEDEHLRAAGRVRELQGIARDARGEALDDRSKGIEEVAERVPTPRAVELPPDLLEALDDEVLDRCVLRGPRPHGDRPKEHGASGRG